MSRECDHYTRGSGPSQIPRNRLPYSLASPSTGVHIPRATPQITLLSHHRGGRDRGTARPRALSRCVDAPLEKEYHPHMRHQEQRSTDVGANHRATYTLTKQRSYPTGSLSIRGFGVPTTYIGMSRGQRNSLAHCVSVPLDIAGRLSGRDRCLNALAVNHGCWSLRHLSVTSR
jgi:hypothetical protein